MAMIPCKYLYENAHKYFKGELSEEEKKKFERTLEVELKVAKEVFR